MLTGPPGPGYTQIPAAASVRAWVWHSTAVAVGARRRGETLVRPRPYQCHGQAARLSARAEVTFAQISRGSQLRFAVAERERRRKRRSALEGLRTEEEREGQQLQ